MVPELGLERQNCLVEGGSYCQQRCGVGGAAGHIPRRGDSRGQAKAAAAGFEGGHFGVCSRDQLPEAGSLHLPGIPVAQAIMG